MLHKLSLKAVTPALGSKLHGTTSQPLLSCLHTTTQHNKQHTHKTHSAHNKHYKHYAYGSAAATALTLTALYASDDSAVPTHTSRLFHTAYADSATIPDTLPVVTPTQFNTAAPGIAGIDTADTIAPVPVKRSKLRNPGKFDHAHRESQSILNLNIHPGASLRYAQPMYMGTDEERVTGLFEKQMTFLPAIMLGGPEGSGGQLHVITQLGQVCSMR